MTPRALILDVAVRALYPVMLLASFWILLRGHDEPGGGFIAGMIAVAATSMVAVAHGSAAALRHMPFGPMRLAAASALVSLASGLPALLTGQPFMTHLWHTLSLGITQVDVSTVLVFDIGVYGAVWSALGGICAQAIAIDEGAAT
jgi:multicomponent Na+:H+ antiporter subunit B